MSNKAILIIDMPENCNECNFSSVDGDWCQFHGEISFCEYVSRKPDDCPLKPMPEKSYTGKSDYLQWGDWEDGWNACIDAITGSEEK